MECFMGWVVRALRGASRICRLGVFADARAANVAVIFALAMMPLMAATGAAVDISRALWVRARLSQALDAAGLAAGSATNMSDDDLKALITTFFDADYPTEDLGTPGPLGITINGNVIDLSATAELDTTLMAILGIDQVDVGVTSEITRESKNLEIAVALDTTGSMATNNKIQDLQSAASDLIDLVVQDVQTPTYSKMAIVPWSVAVNVGNSASQVRGDITPGSSITNASWASGPSKTIAGATRANPVVITSAGHGFANGDRVYIQNVGGMSQINNEQFTVTNVTANTFALQGVNGSGYGNYSSGGKVTKCQMSDCSVVVTANGHGLSNGDHVYIVGVGGMTQINNQIFTVASATANTFGLSGTNGPSYSAYTSGGTAYCTVQGCEHYYFRSASGSWDTFQISDCVSERTGINAYTDTAPSIAPLGRNYALTSDKTVLHNVVSNLAAEGSTGGHIGTAWTWYAISPNFAYLWPADSQPAAYGTKDLLKVAVLMTDGLYNSTYCNGVISQDSTSGSGSSSDHINCNAPNGDSYSQARSQCDGMKQDGILVYTVGFDISNDPNAQAIMNYCATDASHVYLPNSGEDLKAAFHAIGQDVTSLRISK
jgi:Flp pilus assembly protein TadG